jgi:hypothetical protein
MGFKTQQFKQLAKFFLLCATLEMFESDSILANMFYLLDISSVTTIALGVI